MDEINFLGRFNINKNAGSKCKQYVVNDMENALDTIWMEVVWASDGVEYDHLKPLDQSCVHCNNFIDYVKDTWLTPYRHKFFGA